MDRVSDEKGEQSILSVIIDKEKSTFENIVCKIKENEEGIISDSTMEKIRTLLEKSLSKIGREEYDEFKIEGTPLINLVYDVGEVSIEIYSISSVKSAENYEKLEKQIIKSAEVDLEIAVR